MPDYSDMTHSDFFRILSAIIVEEGANILRAEHVYHELAELFNNEVGDRWLMEQADNNPDLKRYAVTLEATAIVHQHRVILATSHAEAEAEAMADMNQARWHIASVDAVHACTTTETNPKKGGE